MAFFNDIKTYIIYSVTFTPIILPLVAMFSSILDGSFRGMLFILGLVITMTICGLLANTLPSEWSRANGKNDKASAICSLTGGEWGKIKSLPDPHAIVIAFTLFYVLLPIMSNETWEWQTGIIVIAPLLTLMFISANIRNTILCCSDFKDVAWGWILGAIFGMCWYFTIGGSFGFDSGLTYFENNIGEKPCTLKNKVFKCSKRSIRNN